MTDRKELTHDELKVAFKALEAQMKALRATNQILVHKICTATELVWQAVSNQEKLEMSYKIIQRFDDNDAAWRKSMTAPVSEILGVLERG